MELEFKRDGNDRGRWESIMFDGGKIAAAIIITARDFPLVLHVCRI